MCCSLQFLNTSLFVTDTPEFKFDDATRSFRLLCTSSGNVSIDVMRCGHASLHQLQAPCCATQRTDHTGLCWAESGCGCTTPPCMQRTKHCMRPMWSCPYGCMPIKSKWTSKHGFPTRRSPMFHSCASLYAVLGLLSSIVRLLHAMCPSPTDPCTWGAYF